MIELTENGLRHRLALARGGGLLDKRSEALQSSPPILLERQRQRESHLDSLGKRSGLVNSR